MDEYIDKEALITSFLLADYPWADFEDALEIVVNAPAADVAPVNHGEWLPSNSAIDYWVCSICASVWPRQSNYCPKKKKKMEGDEYRA